MTSAQPRSGRRSPRFAAWGRGAVLAGCLLLAGCQASAAGPRPEEAAPPIRATGAVGDSRPVSIQIPVIGVDARVVPVGLGPGRTMEVPAVDLAGWYEPGPRPGEAGPAVIVGHVDSRRGPAVFFRLGQLHRGDRIVVGRAKGPARSFVVERVERRPKKALPTARIWNDTGQPVLRLITCGGSFDRASGHYRDNVIVYASLSRT
jgi:sortase (surface protein transpeptidase)